MLGGKKILRGTGLYAMIVWYMIFERREYDDIMAKECYFTGRKAKTGNNRSHALNASKRSFKANLQKVRIIEDGKPKRVWASARAIKSGLVKRA